MSRNQQESLTQDDVFDILSNSRRRFTLYYLREAGEPVELDELARELAAWENDTTVGELTKQQRKRVYVSLYQTHIQKLSDAGIVEYDQDTGMLALANGANQIGAYLSVDEDDDARVRWQEYYIVLSAASGLLYALVAFDVALFSLVSELQMGIVIVLAFAALATAHYVYTRQSASDIPADALIQDRG